MPCDTFPNSQGCLEVTPASRHNSAPLDMLAALTEEHSELSRHQAFSQVKQLELDCLSNPLNSSIDDLQDAVGSPRARASVGLRDLIEREMHAQAQLFGSRQERGRVAVSSNLAAAHRAQSVDQFSGFPSRGYPERRGMETSQKSMRISELYKELEKVDAALQDATQENRRLKEEKSACVAAHERDVAALESMLKSVMDENAKLKESLGVSNEKNNKHAPWTMTQDVQRNMISDLIQSGISNVPQTPKSEGSSSTQTPPFEPEAELSSLDASRRSIDVGGPSPSRGISFS